MSNKRRSRALFVKADGGPMRFSLVPCSERKEIRELVEYGGGVLVQPEKVPDTIRLVPSSVTITDSTDDVFSTNYIRACSNSDKLFRLIDFKIPTAPAVMDASDAKTPSLRFVRTRREYTLGEEIAIAKFIAKKPGARVRGNAVYKEMASASVVPGKHSWQSLKEHYLKKIFPLKHLYESPDAVKVLSRRQRREAARDPSSSPLLAAASDVLVGDSSSNEQDSREPQRPSASGIQEEKTPTEVVPETESSSSEQCSGTPVVSAGFCKSKIIRKLSFIASPSAKGPDKALTESSSKSGTESPSPKKVDRDHSTSVSDQGSTAVTLRKRTLPTSPGVHRKKEKKPSVSSTSVRAASRLGLRSVSTNAVDVPGTTGQEPILNEQRGLRSSLGRCKNATPQKQPTARHSIKSGSQSPSAGRTACTVVSKDRPVSDGVNKRRIPVKLHPQTPVKSNSATRQECSSSHLGKQPLPQSSDSSVFGDVVKHASPPSRRMPLRTSPRKRPNASPQGLTDSHSNSQPRSKSVGDVSVTPKAKRKLRSPERFRGNDSGTVADLSECTRPLSRQGVKRSSPRKQQSAGPQKGSSSHSSTWRCCEPTDDAMPETDSEDLLAPFHAGRSLLPCALPADKHKKKGISLQSEQASDSVSSGEQKRTDSSHKSNTMPLEQQKTGEEHGDVSHQKTSLSSMPSYETASSGMTPDTETSTGKCTRSRSLLRKPRHELGSGAPKAKAARGRRKAPQGALSCQASSRSPSPPQHSDDGHSSSACQGAGTEKNHRPLLSSDAEVEGLDSADEALLTEALVEEATLLNPRPTPDVAEDHPVVATKEVHDVSEKGSLSSTVSMPSKVTISDSRHSADEDSAPESEQDEVSKVRRALVRLLRILRAGKNTEPHKRCPAQCGCPRSTRYIRTARAAVSLSAFLAYHGRPLPSESPGIEDPEIALLLEVLLRRLEGSDSA